MAQHAYPVQFEISGPAAMFNRPDAGASFISYPAPTYSAAKGMFESIARLKSAYIRPTKVEICRPIRFHRYTTNYGGPLRKTIQLTGGTPYQLSAVILSDVCYRLYGTVEAATPAPGPTNHLHALQEMFLRRIERGQSFRTPCLGWSEFLPDYVGPFRDGTKVETCAEVDLPSMLHTVFDLPISGEIKPSFRYNVKLTQGVLRYAD